MSSNLIPTMQEKRSGNHSG